MAEAHGFGQRYELPLPLSLYLYGAAAVVALSFLLLGLFVRQAPPPRTGWRFDLSATVIGRLLTHPVCVVTLKAVVLALFVVTIVAGLIGDQNPYRNIAPTLVWIIWWVGLAYVAAFVGDLWALVNPWHTVFDAVSRLTGQSGAAPGYVAYPRALGVWPACLLLLGFAWLELVYPNAASPAHIAGLTIAYSVVTFAGMVVFGRDAWLRQGEVFSVFFAAFARFAPTEVRGGRLWLRPFAAGLRDARPVSPSMMAFVLLMLATVLYDGLSGTGEWAAVDGFLRGFWPGPEAMAGPAIATGGLVAFWLLFLGAYLGICAAMSRLAGGEPGALEVGRRFALSLIPIAIGYHVAHYLVFLLVQGQYIIPLASDPFGYGWDLFGTAGYRVDIAIAGARFAWYAALAAIVAGHLLAVYLAHLRAMTVFAPRRVALATQAPMTVLMVLYTFIGLSIAAEPITESRSAAEPLAVTGQVVVPPDALRPDALAGYPRAEDAVAEVKLTSKVMASAFHDGSKTGVADIAYAYVFAYRWGTKGEGDRFDPEVARATAPLRRHLVALRATGSDTASRSLRVGDVNFVREVITVETYLTLAPGDAEWNAAVAPPWSALPWHLIVLMEQAVERGWAAFSQGEAERRHVPWLDLVRDRALTARLAALATEFARDGFRPEALQGLVNVDEARARWTALGAFYRQHGHLLITNGPYRLKGWTDTAATLEAFRDLTYPLGVGSFDVYATPRRGFVTRTEWRDGRVVVSGEIETIERYERNFRIVRTKLESVPAVFLQRAAPECRYVVTDAASRVVLAGAEPIGEGARFAIALGDRLPPGRYTLAATIVVNGNAMNAEIARTEFTLPATR
ncbi:MAG: hypothetical protein WBA66_02875 [Xanthobacteraceae bacterium]